MSWNIAPRLVDPAGTAKCQRIKGRELTALTLRCCCISKHERPNQCFRDFHSNRALSTRLHAHLSMCLVLFVARTCVLRLSHRENRSFASHDGHLSNQKHWYRKTQLLCVSAIQKRKPKGSFPVRKPQWRTSFSMRGVAHAFGDVHLSREVANRAFLRRSGQELSDCPSLSRVLATHN